MGSLAEARRINFVQVVAAEDVVCLTMLEHNIDQV